MNERQSSPSTTTTTTEQRPKTTTAQNPRAKTISVSTTWPDVHDTLLPPFSFPTSTSTTTSSRLVVRPLRLTQHDLGALWSVRSQPEAMTSSGSGLPDTDMERQTRRKLERLQPPYRDSHVYFGIFLQRSESENRLPHGPGDGDLSSPDGDDGLTHGECQGDNDGSADGASGDDDDKEEEEEEEEDEHLVIIGDGGVHKFTHTETGWPEFGYKLRPEFWNRGYMSEFAGAFMEYWWNVLPRKEVRIEVARDSIEKEEEKEEDHDNHHRDLEEHQQQQEQRRQQPEQLCAWTKLGNVVSEKVLTRLGFQLIQEMSTAELHHWRLTRELYERRPRKDQEI